MKANEESIGVGFQSVGALSGTVKWFNESKGFGFIESDEGRDVFVHHSALKGSGLKSLEKGQTVDFKLKKGSKELEAGEVSKRH